MDDKLMDDLEFKMIFPFQKPRKLQRKLIETVLQAYKDGYKHVCINAPTGIGKSIIGMAVSNWFANNYTDMCASYILTSQKLLQDQYVNDFHIPTVKGRDNYPCTYELGKVTCAAGICVKAKWNKQKRIKTCPTCPYYIARDETYSAPISTLNYAYFLNMGFDPMQEIQLNRKLLVLDECHNTEQMILNFSTVVINRKECVRYNMMDAMLHFPSENDPEESKFQWLFEVILPQLIELYKAEESFMSTLTPQDEDYNSTFKKLNYMKVLLCNISNVREEFLEGRPCAVLQNKDFSISYKPIFGKNLAKKYLFPFSEYTLSMSATILSKDQFCRNLGLTKEEVMFIKTPSLFPIKNRPIYSCNIGSMSYKDKKATMPKILNMVKLILEQHKNERGIIHTVNYELAEYLITNLKSNRLIMPKGRKRDKDIKKFMESKKQDLVLISPSLQEGIDLKDDLSRFTVICKLPFASLADNWVLKRMNLSPSWYTENTIQHLVQACGRSVRTEKDFAVCYILDSGFDWFYKKNKNKFPKWWSDSVILK